MMKINEIYLGDAYELIKKIDSKSIDLVVIDPPYHFVGGGKMTGLFRDRGTRHFDALENTNLTDNYDLSILDELVRVMKKINIYIWCNKEQIHQYLDFFENKNTLFEILIWNKTNPMPLINNQYLPDKEYCMFFRERGVRVYGDYESKKTVYIEQANVADKKLYNHPTIKPLNIIKNLITNSSKEGDLILDTFLGSGTTAVACKELGRDYIGFEIDENYYNIAIDRLKGISQIDRELKNLGQIDIFEILDE